MDGIEADVVHFDIPHYFEVCRKVKPVSKLNPQITSDKDFAREIGENMMIDDQVASNDQIFIGLRFVLSSMVRYPALLANHSGVKPRV